MSQYSLETRIIHAGETSIMGAVTLPVFQTAMFAYEGGDDYDDLKYVRLNNSPNHEVLHAKLASLEGGEAALVCASGMAAITTTLLSTLRCGDHLLAQNTLYGGTHSFITKHLPDIGVNFDFIDASDPESWARLVRPNTRLVYTESMTNPLLQVIDHRAVVAFAKAHQLVSIIDNTFASPINFRPLSLGYDLSVHSATKYLNGHSDLAAGAVIGSSAQVQKIKNKLNHLGACLDPHACFLLHRGLKTLAVRVAHQNAATQKLASFLSAHPAVISVNYPGLPNHPTHDLASDLFDGFCGVLSFRLAAGADRVPDLVKNLQIPLHTFSLGGVETLIIQPARTSHATLTQEQRDAIGISDDLIRLSVGLESPDDLIKDFEAAFESIQ